MGVAILYNTPGRTPKTMFVIYSVPDCRDCKYAKVMLEDFECEYEERPGEPGERARVCNSAGARSFPLIYHGGTFIGGFNELGRFLETQY